MKLFWKIFIAVFISFIVAFFVVSYILTLRLISDEENRILEKNELVSNLISNEIERGYLESKWPFESLRKLSERKDVLFWWVIKDDGVIYLADNASFVGSRAGDYFPQIEKITKGKNIFLNRRQNYGILFRSIGLGEKRWLFALGFSIKEVQAVRRSVVFSSIIIFILTLGMVAVALYFIIMRFIKPINDLSVGAAEIGKGNLIHRIKMQSNDELGELAVSFNKMADGLQKTTTSIVDLNKEIAERKRAEEALKEYAKKAEDANQNKTQFVSDVSHELRTPLASIKGYTATIRTDKTMEPETREEFLKIVEEETDRLSRIIDGLLDLSRIESGRINLKKEDIKLTDLIKKNVETVRKQADKKQLALKMDLPEDIPFVLADSDKISQVIINLLSNAIKYTKEGEVMISAKRENGGVLVSVSDTGIGIDKKDLPMLFNKFARIEKSEGMTAGTGLGLSIVKALVELHGGKVFVESEPGRGSRFGFRLPAVK